MRIRKQGNGPASWSLWLLLAVVLLGLSACSAVAGAEDQRESAGQPTSLADAGPTTTTGATASATSRATGTARPTATYTHTPTAMPSSTVISTAVPSPQNTATGTATAVATATPTDTPVPSPTATLPAPTPSAHYSPTLTVPILMYHYISVPPEGADIYRTDLSVTPEQFREQMAYLADNGFTTIDLYELSLAIADKIPLPPKPVLLTFDDGYRDAYTNAFPIMQEYGLKGTFFVITELVDNEHVDYLTWEMVEEMAAAGHRMESHSKTHPDLRGASNDELVWQIRGSQETLAAHVGYVPRYFCYPGGDYDENTILMLQELDFWGALTTAGGKWHNFDNRYEWTRLRMRNATVLAEFVSMIEPAP